MGRPTKLTPELQDAILAKVRSGAGLDTAAESQLVSPTAVWRWQRLGREAQARIDADDEAELTETQERYLSFSQGVARARAEFEISSLERLNTLDTMEDLDPKIAASLTKSLTWLLERTRRETYGSQITIKVEEAKEYLLTAVQNVCERLGTPEVLAALLDELERGGEEVAREDREDEPRPVH